MLASPTVSYQTFWEQFDQLERSRYRTSIMHHYSLDKLAVDCLIGDALTTVYQRWAEAQHNPFLYFEMSLQAHLKEFIGYIARDSNVKKDNLGTARLSKHMYKSLHNTYRVFMNHFN